MAEAVDPCKSPKWPIPRNWRLLPGFALLLIANACGSSESSTSCESSPLSAAISISGSAYYDYIPALDSTQGGIRLAYDQATQRPIRYSNVTVEDACTGEALASSVTNDQGAFAFSGIQKKAILRVYASSVLASSTTSFCTGHSWNIQVVDNTAGYATYALSSGELDSSVSGLALHAATTHSGIQYTERSGAPFAILDTALSELNIICNASLQAINLPKLRINWSVNNIAEDGVRAEGQIVTSHYTKEDGVSQLYILGHEDIDTDEYDDHVIAHEFGHYIENELYRSDSIGGRHSGSDSLDIRVAFGEGFGNAMSAITFQDAMYVDTGGASQDSGMQINIDSAPTSDGKGIFSSRASQYLLWNLFKNENNSFAKIHTILSDYQRTSAAVTSLLTFSAYFFGVHGNTSGFSALWSTTLNQPLDALCSGTCNTSGGDIGDIDVFDIDNDLGSTYAANSIRYPQGASGMSKGAEFWRIYKTVNSGTNSPTSGRDALAWGNYSYPYNKFGNVRLYRWVADRTNVTFRISALSGSYTCASDDYLDMSVFRNGSLISINEDTSGCPSISASGAPGDLYVITIYGYADEVPGFSLVIE